MRVSSAPCIMTAHISDEKIAAALLAANGNIMNAAKRLKCTRQAIYQRIKNNEIFAAIREESLESRLDLAESQLDKNVKAGDQRAIEFFLKTIGKKRGYAPTLGISGEDGGAILIKVVKVDGNTP